MKVTVNGCDCCQHYAVCKLLESYKDVTKAMQDYAEEMKEEKAEIVISCPHYNDGLPY